MVSPESGLRGRPRRSPTVRQGLTRLREKTSYARKLPRAPVALRSGPIVVRQMTRCGSRFFSDAEMQIRQSAKDAGRAYFLGGAALAAPAAGFAVAAAPAAGAAAGVAAAPSAPSAAASFLGFLPAFTLRLPSLSIPSGLIESTHFSSF